MNSIFLALSKQKLNLKSFCLLFYFFIYKYTQGPSRHEKSRKAANLHSLQTFIFNPAYIVEWVAAVQLDLITGGALKIEAADVTKVSQTQSRAGRLSSLD